MDETIDNKDGQDDLVILHPERRQVIDGRDITMREYGYVESLQLGAPVSDVVAALRPLVAAGQLDDINALRGAFAGCVAATVILQAVASDQPEVWVRGLSARDGNALSMLWWSVNGPFFVDRLIETIAWQRGLDAARRKAVDGATSTPSSSPTATTSTASDATRSVN
jgi:hypothetical protein